MKHFPRLLSNPLSLDVPEEIITPRLHLRIRRAGDGAQINASVCESLTELRQWMPWAQDEPTPQKYEIWCREVHVKFLLREEFNFGIFLRDASTHLGEIGIHHLNWNVPSGEIGYWLRTSQNGNGYMTEAVEALTRFAFETLNLARLVIRADERNTKSRRVAERSGYALESIAQWDERDAAGELRRTGVYIRFHPALLDTIARENGIP